MAYATDFQAELFEGQVFTCWADQLEELKTICYCGRKANFVLRLNEQGEVIKEGNKSKSVEMTLIFRFAAIITKKSAVSFNLIFQFYTRRTILC